MKPSLASHTPAATHVADNLNDLANRQADLVDSFPRFYRLVPPAMKRQVAAQFDEFIVQLDTLVAKLESAVQKRRLHNRKSMANLQHAIIQADKNVMIAAEETAKLPELSGLTAEFNSLREHYQNSLEMLSHWLRQLEASEASVSMAA